MTTNFVESKLPSVVGPDGRTFVPNHFASERPLLGRADVAKSLKSSEAVQVDSMDTWKNLIHFLFTSNFQCIALRGAGSINGMDRNEIDTLIAMDLIPRIEERVTQGGKICLMYDGDSDNINQPDIGYVMGRLMEYFGNTLDGVLCIAVQKRSWYNPISPGSNLNNALGSLYVTYVFEDNTFPGDHSDFTQHPLLVSMDAYEQWYIGACGQTSRDQFEDYNENAGFRSPKKATLFKVTQNAELSESLERQLEAALTTGDENRANKVRAKIAQRERVYGEFWGNDGSPAIDPRDYPNLEIMFVNAKPT